MSWYLPFYTLTYSATNLFAKEAEYHYGGK